MISDNQITYNFDSYLNWRVNIDYYDDDTFLKKALKHFAGEDWHNADRVARDVSEKASGQWQEWAESAGRLENRPYLMHYNAFNQRIDRIVRPRDTELMEREIFSLGLFSAKTNPWQKLIQMFLIYQNGEACISCPLACTDGMVGLLERFAETPKLQEILREFRQGNEGRFAIAAQYITEIQGGSDISANMLQAREENGEWRLYGNKFFCSATHADYAVVTARPENSDQIAAFIVPAWYDRHRDNELRNLYGIERLKTKLGTCELTTAEISYFGSVAYPIGPLDQGIASVVGIVLTYSRLNIGLFNAAVMTRAVREAKNYAEFRQAFGRSISQFPMLAGQLESLENTAHRTTAGAFKIYSLVQNFKGGLNAMLDDPEDEEARKRQFEIRELIMLQKVFSSSDCVDLLRTAMSVFGGHGVIEDFSSLPRLFRDAMVNEFWEGPRNVLLAQLHRDMKMAQDWYPADEFIANLLKGGNTFFIKQISRDMIELITTADFDIVTEESMEQCQRWDDCCHRLIHAFQDNALAEVNAE